MSDVPQKLICIRCGSSIVGIIPEWEDGRPVCRDCAFKGPEKIPIPPRRENLAVLWEDKREKVRSLAVPAISAVAALMAVFFFYLWMQPAAMGPMDHFDITYGGDAVLGRDGQECVANLMVMSEYLAKGAVSWPTRLCPRTGKFYDVIRETGDVQIDCPNPGKHGLERLWVGLKQPVVQAEN